MNEEESVRRVIKKVYPAEDHGGGWKIALSDFMCAMMILFFILWAISQSPTKNMVAVSDYYKGKTPTSQQTVELIQATYIKIKKLIRDQGIVMSVDKTNMGVTIKFDSSSLFKSGSDELLPDALKAIETLGKRTEKQGMFYHIYGYTDDVPVRKGANIKNNLILSVKRATSAAAGLIDGGVPSNRITIHGEGELNPSAVGDTSIDRKKNRRVEIYMTYTSVPSKLYGRGITYTSRDMVEKVLEDNKKELSSSKSPKVEDGAKK
ncbi:flagellar motor protein MotB [Photobacterium damselae]|uniref:OmpA/MotB family protein n=1 Tax=Photobacterium damselae TaxID=38293 RepID=UPI001F3186EE|nr:OmpA family protein [Photobacterium damselae]UKA04615.1 OmpA family protein [Photobacterium damselae subsp. damselae]